MKAGILTFHEADNYGAVLQAYALQQALSKLGLDSEFVTVASGSGSSPAPGNMPPFARRIQAEGAKRAERFRSFRETHLVCSKPYGKEQLRQLGGDYDVFIAGSDQVWNFTIPGADARYLLPFAPSEKCFSYAASFGSAEVPEKHRLMFQRYLTRFSGISVREASGRSLVRELTGRDAVISLDPTLLLDRNDWAKLVPEPEPEAYLLLFMVDHDEELAGLAKKNAEQAGLPLRVVTAAFQPQYGFDSWSGVGVEDWIRLVSGAEGVFTNSFHGCAFSLMFGRPLCVGMLKAELGKRNGRIEELLARTGMEASLEGRLSRLPPEELEEKLHDLRAASIDYLKGIAAHADTV